MLRCSSTRASIQRRSRRGSATPRATRRDRTGDLPITKFQVWEDVVDYGFGAIWANSASLAGIESDSESGFQRDRRRLWPGRNRYAALRDEELPDITNVNRVLFPYRDTLLRLGARGPSFV
jgi:hypothetical protein